MNPSLPTAPARSTACQRGQWSLVGLLVSLVIVAILSAWYYSKILKPQAGSHNGAPAAEQQAYGTACSEYVSQLNMASTMYKQEHEDRPPQSFDDLKKAGSIGDDVIHAPGCQFQLDPATGAVTEIGHGRAALGAPPIVLGTAPAAGPAPPSAPGAPLVLGGPAPSNAPAASGGPPRGPGGVALPPSAGGSVPASGGDGGE
jgi:competence protein ComGC